MRTIVLVMAAWALTVTVSYGQIKATIAGSAEARQEAYDQFERLAQEKALHKKRLESGRSLFGADERWPMKNGTLKKPPDFKIGDWGCTSASFRVISKVSGTECLVLPEYKGSEVMLIRGLDMTKVTDGVEFVLQHPIVIQDTYIYTAVSGGQKTVLVLECDSRKFDEFIRDMEAQAEAALFRTWTSSTGKFSVVAKFVEFKNGRVHLERKGDGKKIELPMSRLSKEDQEFIREILRRQLKERKPT